MPGARNFFSEQEQQQLIKAIEQAELHTSGEIRLHLANFCFGNEVKGAQRVFRKLGMQKTQERNGILIYIAVYSRKIAIVGDEGIHQKLGTKYWEELIEKLITKFKASSTSTGSASTGSAGQNHTSRAEVLAECILDCGKQLGKFFPLRDDDKNELSNTISF